MSSLFSLTPPAPPLAADERADGDAYWTPLACARARADRTLARGDVRRLVARLDERIAAAYLRDEPHAVAELERVREDVQEVLGWV